MVRKLLDHVRSGRHLLDLAPEKPDNRTPLPCFPRVRIKHPEFYTGFLGMQFNIGTCTSSESDLNHLLFSHDFSLAWVVAFEQFVHCNFHLSWEC